MSSIKELNEGKPFLLSELWKESNARLLNNKATTAFMLIVKIKDEVALWSLADAKAISNIIPCE
jgi:hypothetical protein